MAIPNQDLKNIDQRTCTKCNILKPQRDFYKTVVAGAEELANECKPCIVASTRQYRNRKETPIHLIGLEKKCSQCKEIKSASEFLVDGSGYGYLGLKAECRKCSAARTRRYRRTPERLAVQNIQAKARREIFKDKCFVAYGGYKCACCGETEPLFLSLDHINNDGAEWRREAVWGTPPRRATGRIDGWWRTSSQTVSFRYSVANCNHGKRMNDGICPHVLQVRRNDQSKDVGLSSPKRNASRKTG